MMRTVTFEVLAGTGPGAHTVRGTVSELVQNIPYLLAPGLVPSLAPRNDLLRRGVSDAGMSGGCRWDPFEIDAEEWTELRDELIASGCRWVQPADWVADYEDWLAWLFDRLYGVPAEEHRRLAREDAELARAIERAAAHGDQDALVELHLQRVRVGEEPSTLLSTHMRDRSGLDA
jgi:hypothetical protein